MAKPKLQVLAWGHQRLSDAALSATPEGQVVSNLLCRQFAEACSSLEDGASAYLELISVANAAGYEPWRRVVHGLAHQLAVSGDPHMAAQCFLMLRQPHDAVLVYRDAGMTRDALAVAGAHLMPSDSLVLGLRRRCAVEAAAARQWEAAAANQLLAGDAAAAAAALASRGGHSALLAAAEVAARGAAAAGAAAGTAAAGTGAVMAAALGAGVGEAEVAQGVLSRRGEAAAMWLQAEEYACRAVLAATRAEQLIGALGVLLPYTPHHPPLLGPCLVLAVSRQLLLSPPPLRPAGDVPPLPLQPPDAAPVAEALPLPPPAAVAALAAAAAPTALTVPAAAHPAASPTTAAAAVGAAPPLLPPPSPPAVAGDSGVVLECCWRDLVAEGGAPLPPAALHMVQQLPALWAAVCAGGRCTQPHALAPGASSAPTPAALASPAAARTAAPAASAAAAAAASAVAVHGSACEDGPGSLQAAGLHLELVAAALIGLQPLLADEQLPCGFPAPEPLPPSPFEVACGAQPSVQEGRAGGSGAEPASPLQPGAESGSAPSPDEGLVGRDAGASGCGHTGGSTQQCGWTGAPLEPGSCAAAWQTLPGSKPSVTQPATNSHMVVGAGLPLAEGAAAGQLPCRGASAAAGHTSMDALQAPLVPHVPPPLGAAPPPPPPGAALQALLVPSAVRLAAGWLRLCGGEAGGCRAAWRPALALLDLWLLALQPEAADTAGAADTAAAAAEVATAVVGAEARAGLSAGLDAEGATGVAEAGPAAARPRRRYSREQLVSLGGSCIGWPLGLYLDRSLSIRRRRQGSAQG